MGSLRGALIGSCLLMAIPAFPQHMHGNADAGKHVRDAAPLLNNIGHLHHPVSTRDQLAQRLFDQGLMMDYAFNHLESERSFRAAAQNDPNLAMAWWGVALAEGSNLNAPVDADRERVAFEAIQKAVALKSHASEVERALIDALAQRYSGDPKPDFPRLEQAYADAMAKVAETYPGDPDIATLYVDAIMNTMPWDYYEANGNPKPPTKLGIAELERVMKRWPDHPGANHLYIHIVEASSAPERAVPAAERLGPFAPAAGHLVHMPSHIWVRVGRWADAVEANENASKADEDYISQCHAQGRYPLGYYPHNLHMLTFASMMEGRSAEAIATAHKAAHHMPKEMQEEPPSYAVGFLTLPYYALVRFGRWDDVLAEPEPLDKKGLVKGMWHYARGMAYTHKQSFEQAGMEIDAMDGLLEARELDSYRARKNASSEVLGIARATLAAELAAARKENNRALALYRKAVDLQDHLKYDEPEDWYYGARQSLGNLLLHTGHAAEAQSAFEEDLKRHPENGWALFGLSQALRAQDNNEEAAKIDERFQKAWSHADVRLTSAVF